MWCVMLIVVLIDFYDLNCIFKLFLYCVNNLFCVFVVFEIFIMMFLKGGIFVF